MKIRFQLILGFGLVAFLIVIVGYAGYAGVNEIFDAFDVIADETAPELIILGQIESLSYRLQSNVVSSVLFHSKGELHDSQQEFEEFEKVNKKLDQAILGLNKIEKEEGKHFITEEEVFEEEFTERIVELKTELYGASLDLINAGHDNTDDQTLILLKTELEQIEEKFVVAIEDRIEQEKEELVRRDIIADQLAFDTTNFVITASILGITLAIIFGVITSSRISNSITNLRNVSKEITYGNFKARSKVEGNNELTQLASDVNVMADSLSQQKKELIKNEKINALGHITSRLAHNLKNPLTVIKATTSIIESTSPNTVDKKTQERLNLIKTSTENISNQIEDILDFVKQKPLELKEASLSEILNTAIKNIKKPEEIKINLPEKDIMIKCDAAKLQVVFMNMITNSIEAVEGYGEITIDSFQNGRETTIEVTDTGKGVGPDDLEKIFDALYTTKPTGTGLGLPYCKSVIEQHGGSIEVSMGSTKFTIIMPK